MRDASRERWESYFDELLSSMGADVPRMCDEGTYGPMRDAFVSDCEEIALRNRIDDMAEAAGILGGHEDEGDDMDETKSPTVMGYDPDDPWGDLFDRTDKAYREEVFTPGDVSELRDAFVSECESLAEAYVFEGTKLNRHLSARIIADLVEHHGVTDYKSFRDLDERLMPLPRDRDGVVIAKGDLMDCVTDGKACTHRGVRVVAVSRNDFVFEDESGALCQSYRSDLFWRHHEPESLRDLVEEAMERARECNDFNGNWGRLLDEMEARVARAASEMADRGEL